MEHRLRPARMVLLLIAGLALAACSGPDESSNAAQDRTEAATATSGVVDESAAEPVEESTSADLPEEAPPESDSSDADVSDESSPPSVQPAQPFGEPQPASEPDPTSAWIARRSMSATSIDLAWSAPEGAATYRIHRLPRTSDSEPAASEMTSDNEIHDAGEAGESGSFLDSEVSAGSLYWYGVRGVDQNGQVLSAGWHRADAVTDEQAPAPVEFSLEVEGETVLLSWTPPEENYQLHSYQILRGVDGEEPEPVSQTWNLDQTSFEDPDPPDGVVTYAVEATDFHWNRSELTEVTVDLTR